MKADNTIVKYDMLSGKERVLCALSGGIDSVVLTHWLAKNAQRLNISVAAAHFSHGIRKDVAEDERQLCHDLCKKLGIKIFFGEGDSIEYAKSHKMGLEEAARELRYVFLNRIADEWSADRIATAHHANDNIETVILNACRGAGVAGLIGIPPVRERFIRPLIETPKCDIEAYADEHFLKYAIDSTNFEFCCRRNEIRLSLLPIMREAYNDTEVILSRFSHQAYLRDKEIHCKAQKLANSCKTRENEVVVDVNVIENIERAVVARIIQLLYKKAGGAVMLSSKHIESVMALIRSEDPSAQVSLPGIVVRRRYNEMIFSKSVSTTCILPKIIKIGQKVTFGLWEVEIIPHKHDGALWLNADVLPNVLFLRSRQRGDTVFSGGHHKSLKKLFIDKKIPKEERDLYPVLAFGDNIIAVPCVGRNELFESKTNDKIVSVIFRRIKR